MTICQYKWIITLLIAKIDNRFRIIHKSRQLFGTHPVLYQPVPTCQRNFPARPFSNKLRLGRVCSAVPAARRVAFRPYADRRMLNKGHELWFPFKISRRAWVFPNNATEISRFLMTTFDVETERILCANKSMKMIIGLGGSSKYQILWIPLWTVYL